MALVRATPWQTIRYSPPHVDFWPHVPMSPQGNTPPWWSWRRWALGLWLGALALLALSPKAAGLAWVLLVLGLAWQGARARWRVPASAHTNAPVWVRTWLAVSVLAWLCQAVMVLYWHDPWGERHGEIRLVLSALALWAASAVAAPLPSALLAQAATALGATAWAGLVWVLVGGRDSLSAHPIPWAVAMGLVSVWLLAMGLCTVGASAGQRRWWLAGGLAALMAVLASRSRGAFGVLLWWALVVSVWAWRQRRRSRSDTGAGVPSGRWRAPGSALLAGVVVLTLLVWTPVVQRPLQALQEAVNEVAQADVSPAQGAQTSVGARLYLWEHSLALIAQSPWLGHGRAARMAHLQAWADEAQSDLVRELGHVHNEFLHQWLDHGVLGLFSQLLYIVGGLVLALQLRRAGQCRSALALAGLVFMHASASLSNVNFAHNHYTSVLSLLMLLALGMAQPGQTRPMDHSAIS